jgi:hypothetical protein
VQTENSILYINFSTQKYHALKTVLSLLETVLNSSAKTKKSNFLVRDYFRYIREHARAQGNGFCISAKTTYPVFSPVKKHPIWFFNWLKNHQPGFCISAKTT